MAKWKMENEKWKMIRSLSLAVLTLKYDLRLRTANSPKSMTTTELNSDYLLAALKTFLSGEMNR